MLAVYLDASGMTGGDWAVMGGFVGDVEKWVAFERDWAELLAEPRYASLLPVKNGKRYAHARRMRQWRRELREQFYTEANYLLQRTVSFAIAAIVKPAEYQAVYKSYRLTVKDSLYGFAFRSALVACCKSNSENHGNQPMTVVLESGDANQGGAKAIFTNTLNDHKEVDGAAQMFPVTTLTVADKEDFGALQVADMQAHCVTKHCESGRKDGEWFGDINYLLYELSHNWFRLGRKDIEGQRDIHLRSARRRKTFGAQRHRPK
jgi:hypothetical protein